MAKLSTTRNFGNYGPPTTRNNHNWEYINAGIYIAATVLLLAGFVAQVLPDGIDGGFGLAVIIIGLILIAIVNTHDFVAHSIGIDFSIPLNEFDPELAFVELYVSLWHIIGDVLTAVAVIFFMVQERESYYWILEKYATNLLIVGPVFWLLGSVQNLRQVYERSSGLLQILQNSVPISFLMGSLLFLLGGIFNIYEIYHSLKLVGRSWAWLGLFGSLLFVIGGIMNVIKVPKMHQMDRGRLERLRGGALERLMREREGRVPLLLEGSGRRRHSSRAPYPLVNPNFHRFCAHIGTYRWCRRWQCNIDAL